MDMVGAVGELHHRKCETFRHYIIKLNLDKTLERHVSFLLGVSIKWFVNMFYDKVIKCDDLLGMNFAKV